MELVFRGGTILAIDAQHRVVAGDVACVDGAIVQVGGAYTPTTDAYDIVDVSTKRLFPFSRVP